MSFFSIRRLMTLVLTLLIFLTSCSLNVYAKEEINNQTSMDFDCKSAILMDASTGTVLYEKNADQSLPPASVTKIMTLLLVMEEIEKGNLKYDDLITTSAYAASMGGSQIFLKEGEQMTAEDMLKSVIIASANDAAVALAEHVCGSEKAFVNRMNARAKELGMNNTHFENTNGLDDTTTNHLTSARDIALMSRELIKHEKILNYSSIWMDSIRNGEFGLTNTNRLVRFYKGATGLKTGSTDKAKFCISATAQRENMHLICVVMGAPSSDIRNSIATQLLNWGFANYELYEDDKIEINSIKIKGGVENICKVSLKEFKCVVEKGKSNKIEKNIVLPNSVTAPINKGDIVGSVEYYLNDEMIGKNEIFSENTINKIDFGTLFVRILSKFLIK